MAKITKRLKRFVLILAAVLLIPSSVGVSGSIYAAAETDGSGLMQELSTLTVDGKKFDAADYPVNTDGEPQLLNLCEFGYGSTAATRSSYGIALYIYNPAQLELKADVRNTVQMKIGSAERYTKYAISLINWSADMLFYKFRVDFTDSEKSSALSALNADERVYEVSSVEFYVKGFNATDYPVSRAFTYTGYASGAGDDALKNTVKYIEYDGVKTARIEVNHTSWRPNGTNGNSAWTQDTIHSVYFAVPKALDEQYDYLKSIHAHWLRARTGTIFVTDNEGAYNSINELKQANAEILENIEDDTNVTGSGNDMRPQAPSKFQLSFDTWEYAYAFGHTQRGNNVTLDGLTLVNAFGANSKKWMYRSYTAIQPFTTMNELNTLYLTVYTGGAAADGYIVSSTELTNLVQNETQNGYFYNDKKVAGKYPSHLFKNYDEEFTDKVIEAGIDKKLDLHSEEVKHRWWNYVFGGTTVENQKDYTEIDAIKIVTDADNVESKSPQEISDSLYISLRDAEDFQNFYKDNNAKNTIYILRFAVSEYYARKTNNLHVNKYSGVWAYDETAGGGYYAQTDCFLDFDLIDFKYAKGAETVVIPVSMSPIDIFPELTPPPRYYEFWKYAAFIAAVLTGFYIVYKIVGKYVGKSVGR